MRAPKLVVVLALVALVALACGSSDDEAESGGDPGVTTTVDDHDTDDHDDGFAFGEPAAASEANRVVDIDMSDEMRFIPDEVTVAVGETITFRLHNRGRIVHDFTIGDAETQAAHEAEMQSAAVMGPGSMGSHPMAPGGAMGPGAPVSGVADDDHGGNAVTVEAGETGELTWHFTQVSDILFGCHIPGHYAAGMLGTFVTG